MENRSEAIKLRERGAGGWREWREESEGERENHIIIFEFQEINRYYF